MQNCDSHKGGPTCATPPAFSLHKWFSIGVALCSSTCAKFSVISVLHSLYILYCLVWLCQWPCHNFKDDFSAVSGVVAANAETKIQLKDMQAKVISLERKANTLPPELSKFLKDQAAQNAKLHQGVSALEDSFKNQVMLFKKADERNSLMCKHLQTLSGSLSVPRILTTPLVRTFRNASSQTDRA